ncbi:MAG: pilin [Patescibacteria group bacterium]
MIKKIKKEIFLLFILSLPTGIIFAEEKEWNLEVDWPTSPGGTSLSTSSKIPELVTYIFEWSIVIGVILTFGVLIYASFQYIVSSGKPQRMAKAKDMLSSSFLGLILLFSSWLLIAILNPELAIITEITIPTPEEEDFSNWDSQKTKDETCDYGIVSYSIRGENKKEKAVIQEGEILGKKASPYYSIACREKDGLSNDIIKEDGENYIKFIEARTVSKFESLNPVCNLDCAQDPERECNEEELIKEKETLPKECFDLRKFSHNFAGSMTGSVKYISQKPGSVETTCLAGDERLKTGGGCVLNLYEKQTHGSLCSQKITDIVPSGTISKPSYDKKINCFQFLVYPPPTTEKINY